MQTTSSLPLGRFWLQRGVRRGWSAVAWIMGLWPLQCPALTSACKEKEEPGATSQTLTLGASAARAER